MTQQQVERVLAYFQGMAPEGFVPQQMLQAGEGGGLELRYAHADGCGYFLRVNTVSRRVYAYGYVSVD